MTREAGTSVLSGPRQIADGLALGAGMVSAAVLTMRPVMFGMEDPSAANILVVVVVVLPWTVTIVAKAVVEGGFVLPPARVTVPLGFLLFLGLVMTVFAAHVWPAEVQLFTWITHALVLCGVYALLARHRVYQIGDGTDHTAWRGRRCGPDCAASSGLEQERDGLTRVVVAAVLATAAVVALYGVYQRYAVLPFLGEEAAKSVAGRRVLANPLGRSRIVALEVFGPFVTANAMAGYLALLLPLTLGFGIAAHVAGRKAAAVAGWVMAGLLVYVLLLTGSSGGRVAAVAGVLAAAVFHWRGPIGRRLEALLPNALLPSNRKTRLAVLALAVLVAHALAVAAFVVLARVSLTMRVRAGYWRTALRMIADRPLGVGLGNFGEHYALYKTPAAWETQEAHNVFLCLAAEAGLAAVVALGFLIRGFLRTTRPGRSGPLVVRTTRRGAGAADRDAVPPSGPPRADEDAAPAALRSSSPRSTSEIATVDNLRALGLLGGLTALLICFVSGPWLTAGLPGTDTVAEYLMMGVLFAAWGVVFWLASSVECRSDAVLAGVVGGVAAIFVHGLVDFTFRIKGIVFTAAALGGVALAVSAGGSLRVRLRGWSGLARSTAVAALLALVLWRGWWRPMLLALYSENARELVGSAGTLDRLRYGVNAAASGRSVDRGAIRDALSGIEHPTLSAMADEVRVVVETGTDAAIKEAVRKFAGELRKLSTDSLLGAWDSLEKYTEEEPGDERAVRTLAEVGADVRRRDPERDTDHVVENALKRLVELSPVSFVPRKLLGELLARQGHLAEAAAAFEKAALRYPEKAELWLRAGDARAFSDHKKAVEKYARALEANRLAEDERTLLYSRYWWTSPKRPASPDFPRRLDEMDALLGRTPEVAFRRALAYAEIGGFAEATAQIDRAIGLRPDEVQLYLFKAIFLEMEAARAGTPGSAALARAAWDALVRMQASAPQGKRISDYTLELVRSRRGRIGEAAAGPGRRGAIPGSLR